MNLICFPHYTCGGLLVDIFSNTFSPIGENGGIASISHSLGKIGDSNSVFVDYDPDSFINNLKKLNLKESDWVGTHCWPGILDLSLFNQLILVTTSTYRSKLYRWTRAYHHYYLKSVAWLEVTGQQRIDKERETSKNYLIPFEPVIDNRCINIEFSEIVEKTPEFLNLVSAFDIDIHLNRWQDLNKFLYDPNIWNSDPAKRFYEAELEINLNKYYVYQ